MAVQPGRPEFNARLIAKGLPVVRDPPKFDLESYIKNYDGKTRLDRLHTIGRCSLYLSTEAYHAAIDEAKRGTDIELYQKIVGELHELDSSDSYGLFDTEWVKAKTKYVRTELEKLDQELRGYKNNLIKESIRMGHEDLGAFYFAIGDLSSAFKQYTKMREFCTTSKHIFEHSQKLLLVSLARHDWPAVNSNVHKIGTTAVSPAERDKFEPALNVCSGLAALAGASYRQAALHFCATPASFITMEASAGTRWNRAVCTGNDVAVYGGLCALASMDRGELQSKVLDNNSFRNFLELEPHIRRAISSSCRGKYAQCLEILEAYRTDYLLDVYLQRHVSSLYTLIRSKSIVQYFVPFSAVTLSAMQAAFGRGAGEPIEEELVDMIQRGLLDARLDLVDRLLVAPPKQERMDIHAKALEQASRYERTLRLKLLKINAQMAELEVKDPKAKMKQ